MGTITVSGTLNLTLGKNDVSGLPVWAASAGAVVDSVEGYSTDADPLSSLGTNGPYNLTLGSLSLPSLRFLPLSDGSSTGPVLGALFGIDSIASTVSFGTDTVYLDAAGNLVGWRNVSGGLETEEYGKGDYRFPGGDWSFFFRKLTQYGLVRYQYESSDSYQGSQRVAGPLGASLDVLDVSNGYGVEGIVTGRLVRFVQGGSDSGGIMRPLGVFGISSDISLNSGVQSLSAAGEVDVSASWDLTPYCLPGISACTSDAKEPIRGPSTSMGQGPIIGYNYNPLDGCSLRVEALTVSNSRYTVYNGSTAFAPSYGALNPTDDPALTQFRYSYLAPQFFDPYWEIDPFSNTDYGLLYTLTLPDGTVLQNWTDATAWSNTLHRPGFPDETFPYLVLSGLLDFLSPEGATGSFGSPPPGMYALVEEIEQISDPTNAFDPPGSVFTTSLVPDPDDPVILDSLLYTTGGHIAPLNRGYLPITIYNYSAGSGGASHHQADAHGRPTFVESGLTGGVDLRVTSDGGATYDSFSVPTAAGGKYPSLFISPKTNARRVLFASHDDTGTNILLTKALADGEVGTDWLPAEVLFPGDYPIAVQGEKGAWDQGALAYLHADGMIHCALSGDGGQSWSEASILDDTGLDFTTSGRPGLASRGNQLMIAYWSKPESALLTRLSKDGGLSWEDPVTAVPGACKLITLAASAEAFYLATVHEGSAVLVRSDDLGQSWTAPITLPSDVASSSSPALALGVIRSTGRLVLGTSHYSDDQGFTWQ